MSLREFEIFGTYFHATNNFRPYENKKLRTPLGFFSQLLATWFCEQEPLDPWIYSILRSWAPIFMRQIRFDSVRIKHLGIVAWLLATRFCESLWRIAQACALNRVIKYITRQRFARPFASKRRKHFRLDFWVAQKICACLLIEQDGQKYNQTKILNNERLYTLLHRNVKCLKLFWGDLRKILRS